jgi:hypothetical protein
MHRTILALTLALPLTTTALVVQSVVVSGAIDKSIIQKVVFLSVPAIRQCYQKQLLLEPTLRGELTVHFSITPKGIVGMALLDGPGLSPKVDSCVTQIFAKMRFPEIDDSSRRVTVYYPFSFEPPTQEK